MGELAETIVLLIVNLMLRGLALSVLWAWFMVPLGVRAITWPHAAGLMVFAQLCNPSFVPDTIDSFGWKLGLAICVPLMSMLIGWLLCGHI